MADYIDLPVEGGSGAVDSVNGKTGVVVIKNNDISDSPVYVVSPSGGDDTTALQTAITAVAAAGGGIVQLLAGTYHTSTELDIGTTTNDLWIRGVGQQTIVSSTLTNNTYVFNFESNSSQDKNVGTIARDATSVTTSTHSDATAFTVGTPVLISGTDGDSYPRWEFNEVLTNGNGTTGVIALKHKISWDLTSPVIRSWTTGLRNRFSDLKIIYASGAAHGCRFRYQLDGIIENIYSDGTTGSASRAIQISESHRLKVRDCQIRNHNVHEMQPGDVGAYGMDISTTYGSQFSRILLDNCGSTSPDREALNLGARFENVVLEDIQILNPLTFGMVINGSTPSANLKLRNIKIVNAQDKGMSSALDTKDVIIENCLFQGGHKIDFDWQFLSKSTFRGNQFINNTNPAGDETCVFRSGTSLVIANNQFHDVKGGFFVPIGSKISFIGNQFFTITNDCFSMDHCSDINFIGNNAVSVKWGYISNTNNTDVVFSGNVFDTCSTAAIILDNTDSNHLLVGNAWRGETVTLGSGTNINDISNMS